VRRDGKAKKADARGGTYFLLPSCVIKSEAWRTASPRAIKALLAVGERFNGFNNGKIAIGARELAQALDCQNHHANTAALIELQARGFIEQTSTFPRGSRMAREFRITFIPVGDDKATHEYLDWKAGDPGTTRKKRVATIATEKPLSVVTTATDVKLSVAAIATEKNRIDENPPVSKLSSVAAVATHIFNHLGDAPPDPSNHVKNASGPRSVNSAAPSNEELRERALVHLDHFGRGSQGRLAHQARIPAGTFSRFLRNGPLSEDARVRLACALPRTETAERRGAA